MHIFFKFNINIIIPIIIIIIARYYIFNWNQTFVDKLKLKNLWNGWLRGLIPNLTAVFEFRELESVVIGKLLIKRALQAQETGGPKKYTFR